MLEDPGVGQHTYTPDQIAQLAQMVNFYIGSVGLSRDEADARARPNAFMAEVEPFLKD